MQFARACTLEWIEIVFSSDLRFGLLHLIVPFGLRSKVSREVRSDLRSLLRRSNRNSPNRNQLSACTYSNQSSQDAPGIKHQNASYQGILQSCTCYNSSLREPDSAS